jgi:hypothetical protein
MENYLGMVKLNRQNTIWEDDKQTVNTIWKLIADVRENYIVTTRCYTVLSLA